MTHDEALALANHVVEHASRRPNDIATNATILARSVISLHAELEAMRMTDEELRCLAWARRQIEVPYSCEPSGTRKGAIEALDRLLAGRGR